ncbi:hypothetical protein [Nevskia sp.]|uniref:hypothetical protein n=1 Tax=Nevskia sp. TaxID=1929292 RepID=UPI0025F47CEB|nr:hypothetical protein [Nevskia sp.]
MSNHPTLADQRRAARFTTELRAVAAGSNGTLDSAAAADFVTAAESRPGNTPVPEALAAILDSTPPTKRESLLSNFLDGVSNYEKEHGRAPGGDLIHYALHMGHSLVPSQRKLIGLGNTLDNTLDSAESGHHDQISLHPNAPAIGIITSFVQAIPFAGYVSADMKSNEGRVIIISHNAENDAGEVLAGDSLDGVPSGDVFMTSERSIALAPGATMAGNFRARMTDDQTVDGASPPVRILKGRTAVYVNGKIAAREIESAGAAQTIVGSVILAGTTYAIGGTVTPSTGAFAITSAPALPAGALVHITGFIDFEDNQSALTARFSTKAEVFKIYANPDRGIVRASVDAIGQFEAEVGLSPLTMSSEAARIQFMNERHYRALRKLYRIAQSNGNVETFNFDWPNASQQKIRSMVWLDFLAVLGITGQRMAEATKDHGVTQLYVPRNVGAQMKYLPRDMFTPAGITERAGIYRLGRFMDVVDVYYSPKVVSQTADNKGATILAIGTSMTAARNPIIISDAVAPSFFPLSTGNDMNSGYGFYARTYTETNPHDLSAVGAALIEVTNLF